MIVIIEVKPHTSKIAECGTRKRLARPNPKRKDAAPAKHLSEALARSYVEHSISCVRGRAVRVSAGNS